MKFKRREEFTEKELHNFEKDVEYSRRHLYQSNPKKVYSEEFIKDNLFLFTSKSAFDISKFNPISNFMENKPHNGVCCSLYIPYGEYRSEWHEYCDCNDFMLDKKVGNVLKIKPDSKVLIINTIGEYFEVYRKYTTIVRDYSYGVDWEEIAKEYDAIFINRYLQDCMLIRFPVILDASTLFIANPSCVELVEVIEIDYSDND